jgi:hypothetical protein
LGKPTKRYLSLRRFSKALGCAASQETSGDIQKSKVVGGNDFMRIEPKQRRLANENGHLLGEIIDSEKASGGTPSALCDRA